MQVTEWLQKALPKNQKVVFKGSVWGLGTKLHQQHIEVFCEGRGKSVQSLKTFLRQSDPVVMHAILDSPDSELTIQVQFRVFQS